MERNTRVVKVGNLKIGGNNPIIIQSMTNTNSADVEATVKQINELEKAGCQLVRMTINNIKAAEAIKEIKKKVNLIEKIDIFDVYSGDKIDKDKKSVAMSIVLRDKNRTLTDEDIDKAMTAILELIKDKYNGEIRK